MLWAKGNGEGKNNGQRIFGVVREVEWYGLNGWDRSDKGVKEKLDERVSDWAVCTMLSRWKFCSGNS